MKPKAKRVVRPKLEVLLCQPVRHRQNGWSFPAAVDRLLRQECAGKKVLQLFGGRAGFGVRMDIDPAVRPDVLADAWCPPFARDSFDVVIVDPPYVVFNDQMTRHLLINAGWMARETVVWFHTLWLDCPVRFRLRKGYTVLGRNAVARCLQFWEVPTRDKLGPSMHAERGPAIKYNRWLAGEMPLPFGES